MAGSAHRRFIGAGVERVEYTKGCPSESARCGVFERWPVYRALTFIQIRLASGSRIARYQAV